MSSEVKIGNLQNTPSGTIAAHAAERIMATRKLCAITIDPQGGVWLEDPEEAADEDLVGTYSRVSGLLALSRAIGEDLQHEATEREFRPLAARRMVLGADRSRDGRA